MLAPGLVVWNKYVTVPEEALNVEVVAYQWGWKYRLPGEDGILGKTDIKFINDENPFGLNLDDPNGKDDLLVDNGDLHLQIDKPVKLLLRSLDVIHNFYVPQFRAKMDMLPGLVTYYWLTPIRTGDFEALCVEFCGVGHYAMRGRVFVDEKKNYNQWLAQQITFEKMLAQNKMENKSLKLVKNTE
jgi:cytochrome c oxidase subunit 2